jgi:ABC-type multidrug transport system fused ATPase/permease subunit
MLQDTLQLAQDSTDFTHFDGRLKTLAEDSDDLKLLHKVEEYFGRNDPYKLEELLLTLKNDLEVIDAVKLLDEYKTNLTYSIEFENVSFRYSQDSDLIFKNINCTFSKGVTHGIVSASGLGKTTFLNLAIGLLKPTTGRVLVNGEDINSPNFDHAKMMSYTAYITQNTQMFMESILVNLSMGNLPLIHRILLLEKEGKVTSETGIKTIAYKLLNSLQNAQALQFVMGQEKGILTSIGDRVALVN